MRFKSVITTDPDPARASEALSGEVADFEPDLAMLFASHHYDPDFETLLAGVHGKIGARNVIGCAAEGIIGPDQELERQPAAVLWVSEMPGVRALPFILDYGDLQTLTTPDALRERLSVPVGDCPNIVVIPDPLTMPANDLLERLDKAFPGSPIVGGMASGAETPGQTRLFLNDQVVRQGAVGVTLTGELRISTVVSQGCRPVGETYVITGCKDNLITELGGRSAYDVLKDVYSEASVEEQQLMQTGVHVGRAVGEVPQDRVPGSFLIRSILGVVGKGAIAVGDHLRRGQTVQFHVRDAKTADHDMRLLLQSRVLDRDVSPAGGLLFTCNGRGSRLFGHADHDIGVVNELIDTCQVAGFFAAGEIGPVGNSTFVHGLTSSLVLFTAPDA